MLLVAAIVEHANVNQLKQEQQHETFLEVNMVNKNPDID